MPTQEAPAGGVSRETAELIADLHLLPEHFTETGVIQRLVSQLTEKDLALTAAEAELKPAAVQAERARQVAKGYDAAHDDKHGREHLIRWGKVYAKAGDVVKASAMLVALEAHDSRQQAAR